MNYLPVLHLQWYVILQYMTTPWKHRFSAALLTVDVESHVAACNQGVHDLIALFPCADNTLPPDIVFTITMHHADMILTMNGKHVWQGCDAGEIVAAFELNFYRRMIGSLTTGLVSMHAATIDVNGRRLTCAGTSGAGKSSLCTRALLAGGSYFSDEFTLLDTSGCVLPFPRPLQWSEEHHPAFPIHTMMQSGLFTRASYRFADKHGDSVTSFLWLPEHVANSPAPLDVILLPHYASTAPPANITPLNRSQALLELSDHLHYAPSTIESVRLLHARIPLNVCFYRLVFSDVHAAWNILAENGIIQRDAVLLSTA